MSDKKAEQIVKQFGSLKQQRANWESHWQEVGDYIIPRKADITKARTSGDKRTELVFDGTALHAAELLSASLHGMLTNPSTPWFSLRFKNPEMDDQDEAKEWLEDATDKMYVAFARSNFQQEVFEAYHDLIAFGTACLMIEEDQNDILRFSSRHIKELYIQENDRGFVDTIYRRFKIPVSAAVEKFGAENLSKDTNKLFLSAVSSSIR